MKKSKFIAGALVLSMGLLGTGYAYWTDALYVSTTVSTGNFEIEFVPADESRPVEFLENMGGTGDYQQGYINNGDAPFIKIDNQDGNKMELGVSNMYPGTHVEFPYEVHNSSTIPMVMGDVIVTLEEVNPAFNNLSVMVKREVVEAEGINGETTFTYTGKGATLKDKLISVFTQAYGVATPNMKETMDSIVISAGSDLDESMLPEESSLQFLVEFVWEQSNAKGIPSNPIQ